ncbi:MAG: hypothetical protein Q7K03_04200 [Dehalococcoidia bacterium]|nr:hypothetical protein [Dehalococcoidia bacterium]
MTPTSGQIKHIDPVDLRAQNISRAAYLDDGGDPARAMRLWPDLYALNEAAPLHPVRNEAAPSLDDQTADALLLSLAQQVRDYKAQLTAQELQVKTLTAWKDQMVKRMADRQTQPARQTQAPSPIKELETEKPHDPRAGVW